VKIPAGAKVVDLSFATVLPGLIDGHVHLTDGKGDQMAEAKKATHDSLNAGFTTLVPQGSHGGLYTDVDLQKQIDSGKAVGPRLITAGSVPQGAGRPARAWRDAREDRPEHHVQLGQTGKDVEHRRGLVRRAQGGR
jgi:imidazolonepropionase-like amidohydrolase